MTEKEFLKWLQRRQEVQFISGKPGRKPKLEGVHFAFQGRESKIFYQGKEIGSLQIGEDAMAESAAKRMFPEQTKKDDRIYRVYGIQIENEYQGRGWGMMLYLYGYNQFPGAKFYNSQAWEPAILTLNRLKQEGWIELHWRGQMGGVHISWLTPSGKANAGKLEKLQPPKEGLFKRIGGFFKGGLKKGSLRPEVVDEYVLKVSDDPNLFHPIVDVFKNPPYFKPDDWIPHIRHGSIMNKDGEHIGSFLALRGPSEDEERTGVFFENQESGGPERLLTLIKQDPRAAEYFA